MVVGATVVEVVVLTGRVVEVVTDLVVEVVLMEIDFSFVDELDPAAALATPRRMPSATTPPVMIHFVFCGQSRLIQTRAIPIGQHKRQAATTRATCSYHCGGFEAGPVGGTAPNPGPGGGGGATGGTGTPLKSEDSAIFDSANSDRRGTKFSFPTLERYTVRCDSGGSVVEVTDRSGFGLRRPVSRGPQQSQPH